MAEVERRAFGGTGVELSQLSFGSMRLPDLVDGREPSEFLFDLARIGIDTHHSSSEYDSYDGYTSAVRCARRAGATFSHIVKIAEPSWDHDRFDAERFADIVQRELAALDASTIDVVQWLVRTKDPQDNRTRLRILDEQHDEIVDCFASLRNDGMIRSTACFGYTAEFTEAVLGRGVVDGLTGYLNPLELADETFAKRFPTIAIRPFAGGEVAMSDRPAAAAFALERHPLVASTIVSLSSRSHARDIVAWAGRAAA